MVYNRFFGFHTKEYKNYVADNVDGNNDHFDVGQDPNLQLREDIITPSTVRSCTWSGVLSYGTPINNPRYIKYIGRIKYRIQPGYEAVRVLRLSPEIDI